MEINKVTIEQSVGWLKSGFSLFSKTWLTWIVGGVAFFVAFFILNLIPLIGQLLTMALGPLVSVGVIMAIHNFRNGQSSSIGQIIEAVKGKLSPVIVVILVNIGLSLISAVVIGGGVTMGAIGGQQSMATGWAVAGLGIIVGLAIGFMIFLANVFSLPLIALTNISGVDAVKASISANISNIVPMLVYGVISFVLFFLAMIPLGLGLIVVIPMSIGAIYFATKDIFKI
jgi:uncharacterized membrane protein